MDQTYVQPILNNQTNKLNTKSKYNGGEKNVNSRDRSADELRYSIRSLKKYLPWFNGTIFIVTDDQIPKWLNISNKVIYYNINFN